MEENNFQSSPELVALSSQLSLDSSPSNRSLKRRVTPSDEDLAQSGSRKRLKDLESNESTEPSVDGPALVENLATELECGCCSGLVYQPVVVSPCQHFFCGRLGNYSPLRGYIAHVLLLAAVFYGSG